MKRKTLIIILEVAVVIFISLRIWWLVAMAFLFFIFFNSLYKNIYNLLTYIFLFVVIAAILNVCFFEAFLVPTGSMKNTLLPGDLMLVNKVCYGSQLPVSPYEIPFMGSLWYLLKQRKENTNIKYWKNKRLFGLPDIINDVVVFKDPENESRYMVKRCVAGPGDTIFIKNNNVFVNNCKIHRISTQKDMYKIYTKEKSKLNKSLSGLDLKEVFLLNGQNQCFALDTNEFIKLKKYKFIDSIVLFDIKPIYPTQIFPNDTNFNWTLSNFGPVIIPGKNVSIDLNHKNYIIYKKIFSLFEGVKILSENGNFYLKNNAISSYTFTSDYFFILGDNRGISSDSRVWGFVPERDIVGKAVLILFSYNEKLKWDRLFKTIE